MSVRCGSKTTRGVSHTGVARSDGVEAVGMWASGKRTGCTKYASFTPAARLCVRPQSSDVEKITRLIVRRHTPTGDGVGVEGDGDAARVPRTDASRTSAASACCLGEIIRCAVRVWQERFLDVLLSEQPRRHLATSHP